MTIFGIGGEGLLRTFDHDNETYELINRAIDLGVNYFETGRSYAGSEGYYGNALRERRDSIFLAGKSHARTKGEAENHLHTTLGHLKTGHLDLWQIHDVRTSKDVKEIFGPGGAVEAFIEAKEKGDARFIGVTGHHDPAIIKKCLELFEFDTVLIPINPAEAHHRSFMREVVPHAVNKNIGIIGMKVYARGFVTKIPDVQPLDNYLRYALSHRISTAIIGCDTVSQLEENVKYAAGYYPMTEEEMQRLERIVSPYAKELMYYKS